MPGLSINRRREIAIPDTDLTTPYGTEITVTPARAAQLLARPPIRLADNTLRRYVLSGQNPTVDPEAAETGAKPPRRGDGKNTEGGV